MRGLRSAGKPAVRAPFFRQHEGMLDVADYELVWPPELFAAEARRILPGGGSACRQGLGKVA